MRRSGGYLELGRLCVVALLGWSSVAYTADATDSGRRFWAQWNDYIGELIEQEFEAPDPWEPLNRKIFAFNDVADRYVLKPTAKAYQWVTPDPLEQGIGNMFSNLLEVNTILNDLLQLKFAEAASDTGRLLLNTTVGLAGLFDAASSVGLEKHDEDFGQTLGYWGIGSGPYLVVPLFGSYTLRDGMANFADVQTDYIGNIDHIPTRNQLRLTRIIHGRAALFAAEELITGDRYSFIRDAYLQRREYLVNDGVVEDTFGDENSAEEWDEGEWEE